MCIYKQIQRRVDELLFAAKQLDLLADQLAPRAWGMGTDEYMRRVSHGVLVQEGEKWVEHVPARAGGGWTIGGNPCVYVRENLVRIGGTLTQLSSPGYVQWHHGMEVARKLALAALDAWGSG